MAPEESIGAALQAVREAFPVAPEAEVSLEANPGTLTARKLRVCREAGINRLSLGAQAMDDRLLRALGRIHTAGDVRASVAMARAAGFDDVSLDLMYALPGQSRADWLRTLDAAVALEPEHISAYRIFHVKHLFLLYDGADEPNAKGGAWTMRRSAQQKRFAHG